MSAMEQLQQDNRKLVRLGVGVLAASFGVFGLWAAFAPLDEGVQAPAVVQTEAKRKPIQHPVTAVITKVYVKEGEVVRAGAPLVQLDDSQVAANFLAAQSQYLALKAAESRLAAESARTNDIAFHPELLQGDNAAAAKEYIERERKLFATRRAALAADVSVLEQSVQSAREQEKAYAAQLKGRKAQQELVEQQIKSTRELAAAGFVSKTKLLEEERMMVEVASQVSELTANLDRSRANITELTLRIAQRQREFAREVEASAADVRKELGALRERLAGAGAELKRTRIVSPTDGTVVGLAIQAQGAVVVEGTKIMDIVPQHEGLLIEAQVPTDVVDRVHAGLPADVRFTGFPDLPFLAVEGRVLSVSADRIEQQGERPAHFLARVEITPEGWKKLGDRKLQPGMGADVLIKTGERSLLAYLLKPLVRRTAGAMTEH
ncbi:HlyD family type I secretion periplasmic adaptor subunit [Ramlibacter sp. USB13]|uniref:Membrane fusion protein (MFP) family protein n=1 Tax=Ramlibacter cellulosilyticus TaxID=2764187 RepID=A0A923SD74_9BURK|nr:HlyD family type I secretion periplasmic adaptor subunit [Ramlibacter cellulosilyticus]MBC5785619.1 HlyD family type I secretion periplasmic adaptor subunit [Ramlibacter cellulosilyticus]